MDSLIDYARDSTTAMLRSIRCQYESLVERFQRAVISPGESRLDLTWNCPDWRGGPLPYPHAPNTIPICSLMLPHKAGSNEQLLGPAAVRVVDYRTTDPFTPPGTATISPSVRDLDDDVLLLKQLFAEAGAGLPAPILEKVAPYVFHHVNDAISRWCALLFRLNGSDVWPAFVNGHELRRTVRLPFTASIDAIARCGLTMESCSFPNDALREGKVAEEKVLPTWQAQVAAPNQVSPKPAHESPSGRVKIFGSYCPPVIDGAEYHRLLTPAEYDVIIALINAGNRGLELTRLVERSGRPSARQTFGKLRKESQWCNVLQPAGTKGGTYRIC